MLGSAFSFLLSLAMPKETLAQSIRKTLLYTALLTVFLAVPRFTAAQVPKKPTPTPKLFTGGGEATLEADQQRESGRSSMLMGTWRSATKTRAFGRTMWNTIAGHKLSPRAATCSRLSNRARGRR